MPLKTIPFDAAKYFPTAEDRNELIADALETGEAGYIANALAIAARACGISEVGTEAAASEHLCSIYLDGRTELYDIYFTEARRGDVNRDQLIRALRKYARKKGLAFDLDTKKGKGSHYSVTVGAERTTIQSHLNPGRIERSLKQLKVDPADL